MAEALEKMWEKLRITEDEEEGFLVPTKLERNNSYIMTKVLTSREVTLEARMATMKKVWNLTLGLKSVAIGNNLVLFKFATTMDRKRILQGSPWTFDKNLVVLEEYNGDIQPAKVKFDYYNFGSKCIICLLIL